MKMVYTKASLRWLWLSVFVAFVDQVTKMLALFYFMTHAFTVLPILNFSLAFNRGAAFSFLHHAGGWQHYFFMSVTVLAIVFMLLWMLFQPTRSRNRAIALIIGGALGNLMDRICYGFVVDFIDVHIGHYHWPTFNVADSAICLGVFLLFLTTLNRVPSS